MPRSGPRKLYKYTDEFEQTAVRLSHQPGMQVKTVAAALESRRLGLGPVGAPPAMTFLPRQTEWHAVWWLLPGKNRRHFAWCVSAPGFARQGGRMVGTRTDTVRLALVPISAPDPCPERVSNLDEVIAPAPRDSARTRRREGRAHPLQLKRASTIIAGAHGRWCGESVVRNAVPHPVFELLDASAMASGVLTGVGADKRG